MSRLACAPRPGRGAARVGLGLGLGLACSVVLTGCASAPLYASPVASPSLESGSTSAPSGPSPTAARSPRQATPSVAAGPTMTATPGSAETRPPPWTVLDASGRRVEGQIGTFQWDGVVSSSPLLPGSPVTVGLEQELSLTTDGPAPTGWQATLYPDPTDRTGGIRFGQAAGPPRLRAPARPGQWTLAVQVRYAAGEVLHFWRLTVTG